MKQCNMEMKRCNESSVQFVMSDVREKERLLQILKGVDHCVHATTTKIVPTAENKISEHINFTINGAMNAADYSCALDNNPEWISVVELERWIDNTDPALERCSRKCL